MFANMYPIYSHIMALMLVSIQHEASGWVCWPGGVGSPEMQLHRDFHAFARSCYFKPLPFCKSPSTDRKMMRASPCWSWSVAFELIPA